MERDSESIQVIIKKIIALLRENDKPEWVSHLVKLMQDFSSLDTRMHAVKNILNIYKGGMGSFTDLVLQKDYKMLVDENNQLANMKHSLYTACLSYCEHHDAD